MASAGFFNHYPLVSMRPVQELSLHTLRMVNLLRRRFVVVAVALQSELRWRLVNHRYPQCLAVLLRAQC